MRKEGEGRKKDALSQKGKAAKRKTKAPPGAFMIILAFHCCLG